MIDKNEPSKLYLYAAIGADLTAYEIDRDSGALIRRGVVTLPAQGHYGVPHRDRDVLYVASSDRDKEISPLGKTHHVTAFRVARETGVLTPLGDPMRLPDRPIHLTADANSSHLLVAFSLPAALRVYRVNPDKTPGPLIEQTETIEPGIYPHQVRITPDDKQAILVARGNSASSSKAEDPGSLNVFRYQAGQLRDEARVAPDGGYGFGPRHLDFHPSGRWVYVSMERQNKLHVFELRDGRLSEAPIFVRETLIEPNHDRKRQLTSAIRVHPNGRFVYVANRGDATRDEGGHKVFSGGENNFAVYAINQQTGEPTLIQHVETGGIHCRNFQLDDTGRLLAASHIKAINVRRGDEIVTVQPSISIFRVDDSGKLALLRNHEIDAGGRQIFWMGLLSPATTA